MVAPETEPLERAASHRFLALLLRPNGTGFREDLVDLAREVPRGDGPDPSRLAAVSEAEAADEGFRLLGQAGPVSCLASDYVEGGYADKGPLLADIAGFYRAFGFTPALGEPVDHFSTLFEFLSFVEMKESYCLVHGDPEQAEIARSAGEKLRAEHLKGRVERFAERLGSLAPEGGVYASVAELLLASRATG